MSPLEAGALLVAVSLSTGLLVAVVAVVWWFDRYDREPMHLVAGVFVWGALAAPIFSVAACSAVGLGLNLGHLQIVGGVGPLFEEVTKGIGVLLVVVLSREFDNPTDGVVYGTACGLGFAATENLCYAISGTAASAMGSALLVLAARTVSAAGIHAVSSAAFGGCLGFAKLTYGGIGKAAWTLAGLSGATAIHAGWNLALLRLQPVGEVPTPTGWLLLVPLLYLLYLLTLALFLRSEQRILIRELVEEVELGVMPVWVAEIVPYYRRRVRPDWWPNRRERTVLARLLTRLAFRKHALRRIPEADARVAGLEVGLLRRRIRTMLRLDEAED